MFKERGLPEELVYLAFIESGYNPQAVSRSGAAGVWQFMPFTGRRFGLHCDWWIDERRDPYAASAAAATYLAKLHDMFGDWSLAIAAYNAGEGKIGRAVAACGARNFFELHRLNHTLPEDKRLKEETLYYVPRFIAMVKIANNFELLGYGPVKFNKPPAVARVTVKGGTDLSSLAQAAGMSWETFQLHNPAFRRQGTPPGRSCKVYVPAQSVATVRTYLSGPRSTLAAYRPYTVVRGDSWSRIANRFGVTVGTLKNVNNARSNLLLPGQRVVVPGSHTPTTVVAKAPAPRVETSYNRNNSYASKRYSPRTVAASSPYRVRTGDTLYSLSKRFGCSVNSLMRANNFATPSELMAGKAIRIPGHHTGRATYALRPPKKYATRRLQAAQGEHPQRELLRPPRRHPLEHCQKIQRIAYQAAAMERHEPPERHPARRQGRGLSGLKKITCEKRRGGCAPPRYPARAVLDTHKNSGTAGGVLFHAPARAVFRRLFPCPLPGLLP